MAIWPQNADAAREVRKYRPYLRFYVASGVLTLMICALATATFDYDNSTSERGGVRPVSMANVVVIDLDGRPPANLADGERRQLAKLRENLEAWLDVLDPTSLFLPNEELGFSRVRVGEFERPVKAPEPYAYALSPAKTASFEPRPLAEALGDLSPALRKAVLRRPPPLADEPGEETAPVPPAGGLLVAHWRDAAGDRLEGIAPIAAAALPDDPSALTCSGPTAMLVQPGPLSARVRLERSSGSQQLDGLALTHLRRHLARLAAATVETPESKTWRQGARRVLVYWRNAPGVKQSAPAKPDRTPEGWDDFDLF